MNIPVGLLIPYQDKIADIALDLYEASIDLNDLADSLTDLINLISDHALRVDEEMNKFKQGFAYERPQTTRGPRKKPVLHGVESKRDKRKSNKAS
jgi:hypothetical protein